MAFGPSFGSFGGFLPIAILIKDIIVALDDTIWQPPQCRPNGGGRSWKT